MDTATTKSMNDFTNFSLRSKPGKPGKAPNKKNIIRPLLLFMYHSHISYFVCHISFAKLMKNIDKSQYFGTDVIRLYKNWLNNDNIGIVEKKKKLFESQVVHLFSFNAEETLKQAGIDFHKIPWLKRCPFSKPPLRQELEILNLRMYPRHQI